MNIRIVSLSLVLPLTVFANSNIENNDAGEVNYKLNMSQLDQYEFIQVEKNVLVYEDDQKTIKIMRGAKGLEKYIDNLENQLSTFEEGNDFTDSNHKYEKILSDISFYSSKLNDINSIRDKTLSLQTLDGHFGGCQPFFEQNYNFIYSIFGGSFFVTSSYPALPGPLPPFEIVTITASSELTTITTQGIYHSYSSNDFTGGNFTGGSISASAGYYNGLSIVTSFDWKATSTLSKGKCFEYIIYTGSNPNII